MIYKIKGLYDTVKQQLNAEHNIYLINYATTKKLKILKGIFPALHTYIFCYLSRNQIIGLKYDLLSGPAGSMN